jgi:hypothetical protein
MLKLLQIIAFRDQGFFHSGQKWENRIYLKTLAIEHKISTIFSIVLGVDIIASGIMNQFLRCGEFTINNERPLTRVNLD